MALPGSSSGSGTTTESERSRARFSQSEEQYCLDNRGISRHVMLNSEFAPALRSEDARCYPHLSVDFTVMFRIDTIEKMKF